MNKSYGGTGASGWIPGKIFNSYQKGGEPTYSSTASNLPDYISVYDHGGQKIAVVNTSDYYQGGWGAVTYPASNVVAGTSTVGGGANPYNLIQNAGLVHEGSDGIGYGAGGGGIGRGYNFYNDAVVGTAGGNSGEFKQGSFKLTSTSDIAITVGSGG